MKLLSRAVVRVALVVSVLAVIGASVSLVLRQRRPQALRGVVSAVSPRDGAQDVSLQTPITITFDAPVVPRDVLQNAAMNLKLAEALPQPLMVRQGDTSADPLAGAGRWLTPRVYSFLPNDGFQPASTYHVQLQDAVLDSSLKLSGAGSWKFTTEAQLEISARPFAGAIDVPLDSDVELYFDSAVDPASAKRAISLAVAGDSVPVAGDMTTIEGGFALKPINQLASGTTYEIRVEPGLQTPSGQHLQYTPRTWRFTTVRRLEVARVSPVAGETAATTDQQISVQFNRDVVELASSGNQNGLPQPISISPAVPGVGKWRTPDTFVFSPTVALEPDTSYLVELAGGLGAPDGSTLQQSYDWRFRTRSFVVQDIDANTARSSTNFVSSGTSFRISFSLPVDQASLVSAVTFVDRVRNRYVDGTLTPAGASAYAEKAAASAFLFTPNLPLDRAATYELRVEPTVRVANSTTRLRVGKTKQFTTMPLPEVTGTIPEQDNSVAPGSILTGGEGIRLYFNVPMDNQSVLDNLVIDPAPPKKTVRVFDARESEIRIDFSMLPQQQYQISIKGTASDIFGKQLGEDYQFSFSTTAFAPKAKLVSPLDNNPYAKQRDQASAFSKVEADIIGTYSAYEPARLSIRHVNTPQVDYTIYPLEQDQVIDLMSGSNADWVQFRPKAQPLRKETLVLNNTPGYRADEQWLSELNLGKLTPGLYHLVMSTPSGGLDYQMMAVSKYALTIKRSNDQLLVWAVDVQSGKPAVSLQLSLSYHESSGIRSVAIGQTGADGVLITPLSPLGLNGRAETPFFIWSAEGEQFSFAATTWNRDISAVSFTSQIGSRKNQVVGNIYTDRVLYRPGQEVFLRGTVRIDRDGVYSHPPHNQPVRITINDPRGNTVTTAVVPLNETASFSTSVQLENQATVGEYGMFVTMEGERLPDNGQPAGETFGGMTIPRHHFYGTFTVADYRTPSFNVEITPATQTALPGETAEFTITASYFNTGQPVANAPVNYYVLSAPFEFTSSSEPQFLFGRSESATGYFGPKLVGRIQATTNANGQLRVTYPVDIFSAGQRLALHAEVVDLSDRSLNYAQAIVTVDRGKFYLGLLPERLVMRPGETQSIEAIALDPNERRRADQSLQLTIFQRQWSVREEQGSDGRFYNASTPEDTIIDSWTATTDGEGKITFPFSPPAGGTYRIVASSRDDRGAPIESSMLVYVEGANTFWGIGNTNQVSLVADRPSYTPGETARILVPAPYQNMIALLTLERNQVIEHRTLTISGTTGILEIPITADYTPNVYVSLVLIKTPDQGIPTTELRVGTISLNVPVADQLLNIEVKADKTDLRPRDTVTFDLRVTNGAGRGVRTDLSYALVDQKLLSIVDGQLRKNPTPTYTGDFFGMRPLGVETSHTLVQFVDRVTLRINPGSKGGSGGTVANSALQIGQDLLLRRNFPDLASWNPSLLTDDEGRASVAITLPDNLTTWTMVVRGITADTRFGQSVTQISTQLDLAIEPQIPVGMMVGDRATLRARLQNTTGQDLIATVGLEVSGLQLESPAQQLVRVPAQQPAQIAWNVVATAEGKATLRFSAGADGITGDALELPLDVDSYVLVGDGAVSGSLDEQVQTQFVLSAEPAGTIRRELQLEVVPSLRAAADSALQLLGLQPYTNAEQTVSGFLPHLVAAGLEQNPMPAQQQADFANQLSVRLQRLYRQQHLDGGWGWWNGDFLSQPYLSAYVTQGLVEARQRGYAVDADVLERALTYLEKSLVGTALNSGRGEPWQANARCYVAYVLATAGRTNIGSTARLYEQRSQLGMYGRAYLLLALDRLGNQEDRVQTLAEELSEAAVPRAAGISWHETTQDVATMSSDIRTTAIVAQALANADATNPLLPQAMRYLLSTRSDEAWPTSQESAQATQAIFTYLARTGGESENIGYQARLDGQNLQQNSANTAAKQPNTTSVALDRFANGGIANVVIERRDGLFDWGRKYAFYSARIQSYVDVQTVLPIDHGIRLERAYLTLNQETLQPNNVPIDEADLNDLVLIRLQVVVPEQVNYLVVRDRLPGGLQPLAILPDSSRGLSRSPPPDPSDPHPERSFFSHAEFYGDSMALFATNLPRGTYYYSYLTRATTAGRFQAAPSMAYQMYQPDVYGQSAGAQFTVRDVR